MRNKWIGLGIAALVIVILGGTCISKYNRLVSLDQDVKQQWATVEAAYQQRADEVPRLVNMVKGSAQFEQKTLDAVTEARAKVGEIKLTADDLTDPKKMAAFEAAQNQLAAQLSHVIATAEAYPDLKTTAAFRDLMVAYNGIEERIKVERQRFNEKARDFNVTRDSFPTNVFAGMFGSKFAEKAYFQAQPGADKAPDVNF